MCGLLFLKLFDSNNIKYFLFVYIICFFWAGVSACYISSLNNLGELSSDASFFFKIATKNYAEVPVYALAGLFYGITDGIGAIFLWQKVYDFFGYFGLHKSVHIGVGLNSFFISFTSILGLKIIEILSNNQDYHKRRFIHFFLCVGYFIYLALFT